MGYHTDFSGALSLSRQLTDVEKNYINELSKTRRMKRDVNKLMEMFNGKFGHPTPKSNTPEGIYGREGEYFVGGGGFAGQDNDKSVLDYNIPPGGGSSKSQPGLWCQWIINYENELEWDGCEKFYNYIEWLKYLIVHFFEPWGVLLNGEIKWSGEDFDDKGTIKVTDNVIKIGKMTYTFDED